VAASGPDNYTVRIGGTQAYVPTISAFLADKEGWFKKNGVSAQVTNFAGGGASLQALAAGEVDLINYLPAGVATAYTKGVKTVIVAAGTEKPVGWYLMVPTGSDIKTPADLAGKKIGITAAGSSTDYFARYVVEKAGVTANYIPVGGSGLIPALKGKKVDAILAFPPLGWQILADGSGQVLVDLATDPSLSMPDVWAASPDIIKNHPEALRAALQVMAGATAKLQSDEAFAVQQLQGITKLPKEIAQKTFQETIKTLSKDGSFTLDQVAAAAALAGLPSGTAPASSEIATIKFLPLTATPVS